MALNSLPGACKAGWPSREPNPGSPWQNGKCESFNGRFREECLNMEVFDSLPEAQFVIEHWREHYNTERPHSALKYLSPARFIQHGKRANNPFDKALNRNFKRQKVGCRKPIQNLRVSNGFPTPLF
jgi:transposase InsO family protein